MKYFIPVALMLVLLILCSAGCDKKSGSDPSCNQIVLDQPFIGRISEQWCLEETNFKIKFGPVVEDSRCNVPQIECFWAGRFVMAATIENGEQIQDTFRAVNNWSDTLYLGAYSIILQKVYPETRTTMEQLDPSLYSFEVVVK